MSFLLDLLFFGLAGWELLAFFGALFPLAVVVFVMFPAAVYHDLRDRRRREAR